MANKRSRDRHLAKLAARRQAERHQQQRRRSLILGSLVGVLVIGGAIYGAIALFGGEGQLTASPSASATPTGPGIACGGKKPKAADEAKPDYKKAPKLTIDPEKTYIATMETSCGTIRIELDPKDAPETVNSFVFLANDGYFDGQFFHRLDTSIDVIQGGDPTGTGSGGPGYTIPDELTGDEVYTTGVLAMANAGPDTGGSQFFIITGKKGKSLPQDYTIFGHVIEGIEVAQAIQKLPVADPSGASGIAGQRPVDTIYIVKVTIEEKG